MQPQKKMKTDPDDDNDFWIWTVEVGYAFSMTTRRKGSFYEGRTKRKKERQTTPTTSVSSSKFKKAPLKSLQGHNAFNIKKCGSKTAKNRDSNQAV